jgi:hypothetical protein
MTPQHDEFTNGGSRDCGRFFIDVLGKYNRADIHVVWREGTREFHPEVREDIERTWEEQFAKATAKGVMLYNGDLCRLASFTADRSELSLTLTPTNFKEFLGTNLTRAGVRYAHGNDALANPLGVSTAVTTSDGFLLLGRRSEKVIYNAGRIHPIGGMVEPAEGATPDPFTSILQELRTEANLSAEMIASVVCVGLVRDKRIVQPELVFDAELSVDAATLRRLAAQAEDAKEHEDLILLMNYPSSVVTFMEKHAEVLTPVAMATLLLHGLRHWGSGWFASARGYLQSVV